MVNKNAKGNRIQRKCIKLFESQGYLVSKAGQQRGRFSTEKDLFNLFDIACITKGQLLLVQITCNRPHAHKKFQEFSKEYANNNIKYLQYVYYDRKGWIMWEYKMGMKLKNDLRC